MPNQLKIRVVNGSVKVQSKNGMIYGIKKSVDCPSIDCGPNKVLNQVNCECECPYSPIDCDADGSIKIRDPETCDCVCPSIDCNEYFPGQNRTLNENCECVPTTMVPQGSVFDPFNL